MRVARLYKVNGTQRRPVRELCWQEKDEDLNCTAICKVNENQVSEIIFQKQTFNLIFCYCTEQSSCSKELNVMDGRSYGRTDKVAIKIISGSLWDCIPKMRFFSSSACRIAEWIYIYIYIFIYIFTYIYNIDVELQNCGTMNIWTLLNNGMCFYDL